MLNLLHLTPCAYSVHHHIQKFFALFTELVYVFFYGSQKNGLLFPHLALNDWF
jgi:hypothetical protein